MSTQQEYAVRAETYDGSILTLRKGFASRSDAEDHPVKASLWKRIWVEAIGELKTASAAPSFPKLPWNWVSSGSSDARGQYHIYLVDADGKKIAAIWGKEGQKTETAQHIVSLVNAASLLDESEQKIVQEEAHPTKQSLSRAEDSATETTIREALEFYAYPWAWKKIHDPQDIIGIPDFYSELSFGSAAKEAIAVIEAASKRPILSVSVNINREQQRNTMGVTAGETAPLSDDSHTNEQPAQGLSRATGGGG
jgi:hypothetical protein